MIEKVTLVNIQDMDKVVQTAVNSFIDEDVFTYIAPDKEKRRLFLADYFTFRFKLGFLKGEVYEANNFSSAAIFIPPNNPVTREDTVTYGGAQAVKKAGSPTTERMSKLVQILFQCNGEARPSNALNLLLLATDPKKRNKGYACAIIKSQISKIRQTKTPIYTDTLGTPSFRFFEKLGFVTKVQKPYLTDKFTNFGMIFDLNE